jgi:hypothetical protein
MTEPVCPPPLLRNVAIADNRATAVRQGALPTVTPSGFALGAFLSATTGPYIIFE